MGTSQQGLPVDGSHWKCLFCLAICIIIEDTIIFMSFTHVLCNWEQWPLQVSTDYHWGLVTPAVPVRRVPNGPITIGSPLLRVRWCSLCGNKSEVTSTRQLLPKVFKIHTTFIVDEDSIILLLWKQVNRGHRRYALRASLNSDYSHWYYWSLR